MRRKNESALQFNSIVYKQNETQYTTEQFVSSAEKDFYMWYVPKYSCPFAFSFSFIAVGRLSTVLSWSFPNGPIAFSFLNPRPKRGFSVHSREQPSETMRFGGLRPLTGAGRSLPQPQSAYEILEIRVHENCDIGCALYPFSYSPERFCMESSSFRFEQDIESIQLTMSNNCSVF